MKKVFKILLSSFALFSLISCVDNDNENKTSSSSLPNEVYYHVTFLNYDETKLYEVDVLEGHEAVYSGETPTKAEDDEFTYEFNGWDKDLTDIQADVTTTATFNEIAKVPWGPIDWD